MTRSYPSPSTLFKPFIQTSQRKAFHASRPIPPEKAYISPSKNRVEFGKRLGASGVILKAETDRIPLLFHEVKKALRPSKRTPKRLAQDRTHVTNLLERFAINGNESTFTHKIVPELLPPRDWRKDDDTVFDVEWRDQPPLDSAVNPTLSWPKPDLMLGFQGSLFDAYPLARKELGLFMQPLGDDYGLSFPYFILEAKNYRGPSKVAALQTSHAAALMLRNFDHLVNRSHLAEHNASASRRERLVVLSSVLTPHECTLDCHWMASSTLGVQYLRRQIKRWRFPDKFEDASRGLMGVLRWARPNLESTILRDLGRLERHLQSMPETGSSAPDYDSMSDVPLATRPQNKFDGVLLPGEEPPIGC